MVNSLTDLVTNPMTVAFVGAGPRSVQSARMLAGSGVGRPVAFWNRTEAVAVAAAAEFEVSSFAEVGEMVEATRPDLVAVMTHPSARVAPVAEAVAAGARSLLIEKPVALSPAELDDVLAAAGDCFVSVNTQYQWMPHWQRLLALVADGGVGEVLGIRASVGVDILEQGPHALSLAMAAARAAGLPGPTWVLAAGDGTVDFGGHAIPADTTALFDLGSARLTLVAGAVAPPVPGETVRGFSQQTEILGTRGRVWVSLNQGGEVWVDGRREPVPTRWAVDDEASQTGLFAAVAESLRDPARAASFPTRLQVAAEQARMLFAAIESAETGARVRLGVARRG